MVGRRGFIILILYVSLFGLIVVRLLWLQTVPTSFNDGRDNKNLVQRSVEQHRQTVTLDYGRARIMDRYGTILAGSQVKTLLIIPHERDWKDESFIRRVANILAVDPNKLKSQDQIHKHKPFLVYDKFRQVPIVLTRSQMEQFVQLNSRALRIVPYALRYQEHPIAAHVIGYLSQNPEQMELWYGDQLQQGTIQKGDLTGASGIERSFDRLLHGVGPTLYTHFVNARSETLAGIEDRIISPGNPFYPLQLWTTLDSRLQRETEAIMDDNQIKEGAVVVLDVNNSDVVVMSSRPNYDPYSVLPEQGNWGNKAIYADIPGSIFKTVVIAAALEDGIVKPGQKFYCSGQWDRYHLRCWVREGHGILTLEQAYAQSCNVILAQIAAKLEPGRLEEVGKSLGLFRRNGWSTSRLDYPLGTISPFRQFDGEQAGQLFDSDTPKTDPGVLAQTGIGQRDVRITPLQAANMVATLLRGGELRQPRIASEIKYNNNKTYVRFPPHVMTPPAPKRGEAISPRTARWLTEAMKLTVQAGTAHSLEEAHIEVAGKTGTAEVGKSDADKTNQWFIGYTPTQQPKYAFAILVSNSNSDNNHQALKIADQLVRLLDNN